MFIVSAGVFNAANITGKNNSKIKVMNKEKITAIQKDVEITFFFFCSFLAPIACESKIEIPFVAPIATEVKSSTIGVESKDCQPSYKPYLKTWLQS